LLPVNLHIAAGNPPPNRPIDVVDAGDVRTQNAQPGDWVRLQGFAVTKVDLRDHTITLNLPRSVDQPDAFCVRVSKSENLGIYHEQQIAPVLEGRVTATRRSQVQTYLQTLVGDETLTDTTPVISTGNISLPNPFLKTKSILNQYRDVRTALIHGDLNLHNILVDVDTGHISLIDLADAREDHILHDFLRLETEIVTHLLAGLLHTNALPTAHTMFDFYKALHCATFDLHTSDVRHTPSGLEKPFEAIRAIRHAASRHFYEDDSAEYYQGLLLYLVGVLKFGNLDHHPAAPYPKQAALWGAATIAQLLESAPTCKPSSFSVPGTETPAALLVDYTPEVRVLRKDNECFVPATRGMHLYSGDTVSTFSGGKALVYCQRDSLFTVPEERNQCIDCPRIPKQHIHTWLDVYDTARTPYLLNHFLSNSTLAPEAATPLLLAPRHTQLHDARPTFRWRAVAGATRYRLTLRMPGGITWHYETPLTTALYPEDAPALIPGSGNTAVLEALGVSLQPASVYLEMLDAENLVTVQTQENAIRSLHLSATAECHLLLLLYHRWKLWGAAIQQLEHLAQEAQPLSSALWLHWGELCLRIGLYAESAEHYLQALAAAKSERNASAQVTAHIGLVCTSSAQSQYTQAQNYLAATELQDNHTLVNFMRRRLESMTRSAHPPTTSSFSLFSYARSLAVQIATHLTEEIQQIPDRFLEQLRTMSQYTLKPAAGAWSILGSDKFAAMEMLAMVYITTRTLSETFTLAELEYQIPGGQLKRTLQNYAQQTAHEALGMSAEKATEFALHYANLVENDHDALRQLLESKAS
jgi:tetratricopeptide (TPR) repeat protein